MTERQVQVIWYDTALRPRDLKTRKGEPIEVIDPGIWNLQAGPDFRNAVLRIGGREVQGDVEVHLTSEDWMRHGHGSDYDGVALHVTWQVGPRPVGLPDGCEELCFGGMSIDVPVSCYPWVGESQCSIASLDLLAAAGRARLSRKADLMRIRLAGRDPRAVLYEEVMAALGYGGNENYFRALARAVDLAALPPEAESCTRAFHVAAGFQGEASVRGIRPANRIGVRLRQAGFLFADNGRRLFDMLMSPALEMPDMLRFLRQAGLGVGRAGAVIINIRVPFALATGLCTDIPDKLPREDLNAPSRRAAQRLFGQDHNPSAYVTNGLLTQGLLEFERAICRSGCSRCRYVR